MKFKVVDESFKKYAPKDPERIDNHIIVISICQNSYINEDEYIEFLFKQINDWIDEGYTILSQYDIEVEEDGE